MMIFENKVPFIRIIAGDGGVSLTYCAYCQ